MSEYSTTEILRVTRDGCGPFTYNQLRGQRFQAPLHGIRIAASIDVDEEVVARIALAASRPGTVLCDISAALWWGLPVPNFLTGPQRAVGIAAPADAAKPRHRSVRGRRLDLPDEHIVEHRGCRVTTPARTWVDCAGVLRDEDLLAMGDAGLRHGLFTEEDLRHMTHWAYRRRGVAHARLVLPWLDGKAESPGESRVRYHCLRVGFPAPECQIELHHHGSFIARLDLGWRAQRVALEYDGIVHLPEEQRRKDAVRRNRIQQHGWRLLVVTHDDLQHTARMIDFIRHALHTPFR